MKLRLEGILKLQQSNFRAALLHYVIMLGFFIWFWIKLRPEFQNLNVYRLKAVAPPPSEPQKNQLNFNLQAKSLYIQSIPFWLMTFFAITTFAHTLYATDFFGTGRYSFVVSQGWNPYRWIEYGITASIMIMILCFLDGVRDVAAVYPIVVSMAVVMGQGWIVENQLKQSIPDWQTITASTLFGWVLLVTAFAVLGYTMTTILLDALRYDPKVPVWIPLLVLVEFINFGLFGVQQLKHINMVKKGVADFMKIESGYIKLSLTAKLTLAGFLCYGLLDWQSKSDNSN